MCTPQSSLGEVMEKVYQTGVHRVWMVDDDYRPIGIVSLTDILRIFADHSR